ncbi:MAG TPA: hypothetical protein DEE98_02200 [Elusimicrobia bacterium]|nr:MAG: hypothetical protein A2278_08320 [Elusimicrobia bacterium RIFOXYA12_FULL_49_49]OGS15930.1 MAG: hypothetical protein A2251_01945 [Elusimicrobia bacterium RIFOXYA2_FULL_47_53]OGS26388.1 MAG: hypothetical protein A2339_03325 [Elusimicrobia bacterium RIFOXYB12_FULL_50_12]OGS29098.1 MAG: hypothetical protein A2323_04485 [Elusimicrobia bacterium RIFOXYB2_FULL_46_23]HBU69174.1 hypothetical protein [Elusimicrobiota bacterium]
MAISLPNIKLPEISFLKSKEAIAVDLGSSSIKVVQLKQTAGKYSLVKWGVIPISDGAAELSPQDKKSISAARLGEFLAREKILTKNIVGSVSGNQVIVRYVRFPKLSREELNKTIQFEAEPYIPFDIRDVNLGFHIIGEVVEEGQKKMETILVAAKKDVAQTRLDVFDELNLRPVVIDVDVFALQNAYELNCDPAVTETAVLVNIGASVTNLAIVENNIPKVVRDVFISGNSFTKAIQRNLACDMKTAEEMKYKHTLLVTAEEKEKTLSNNQKEAIQFSSAVVPVARDLLSEIHKSIDFYISQNPERTVNKIYITGGSSYLKNLNKYLELELKIPVEIFNPLKNIAGGENVPANLASFLSIAIGLAVRFENDVPKK